MLDVKSQTKMHVWEVLTESTVSAIVLSQDAHHQNIYKILQNIEMP